jgi:hypothetical protein
MAVTGMLIFPEPSKDVAVPVTLPDIAIVLAVVSVLAEAAEPVTFPTTLPTTRLNATMTSVPLL